MRATCVVLCTSRADSSLLASSSWRLEQGFSSRLEPLGDSSRLGQGSTSRLDSRLEPLGSFLAVSWRLEPARVGSSLGLGSARASSPRCHAPSRLVNNTRPVEENASVACFYFDFAVKEGQSVDAVLGSVLRQIVGGKEIPKGITKAFHDQKKVIGGQKLGLSKIVEFL